MLMVDHGAVDGAAVYRRYYVDNFTLLESRKPLGSVGRACEMYKYFSAPA
jgi:hypothetical protein